MAGAMSALGSGIGIAANSIGGFGGVIVAGIGGGALSKAGGGRFSDGFLGGTAGSLAASSGIADTGNLAGDMTIGAIVGGTVAEIGGGKFANGAMSGAFAAAVSHAQAGNSDGLSEQDRMARDALDEANPISVKDNLEYGGYIYRNEDGSYGYTTPLKGTDQGFSPRSAAHLVPKDAVIVGDYHTHADYSLVDPATGAAIRTSDPNRDAFNSDNFSTTDYRGIAADAGNNAAYRGYLGTPSGVYRAYDPVNGREYVIKP